MYKDKINVLIIGFGSIGKRHYEILKSFDNVKQICVVTKQSLNFVETYRDLKEIKNIDDFDYFIISSATSDHFKQLKYLCAKVVKKNILVEKPLFSTVHEFFELRNNVYTGYNLRFHPVITKLKEILIKEKILYANIFCGQYLPKWRPNQDYKLSYSSDISLGGGVLRDLSHEIDYANWLFGEIQEIKYFNSKISDLEIKSDDIFTSISKTKNNVIVNITIDYISKITLRKMLIHTQNKTIEADLIRNTITAANIDGTSDDYDFGAIDRNFTYGKMHEAIINNETNFLSDFVEGAKIVKFIDNIEFKNY